MAADKRDLSRYLHEPSAGEIWVAPTREMLWWTRKLGWLIAPAPGQDNWLTRLVGLITVTPSAHVANLSLQFQSFLFDVFHQTTTSRIVHVVCMPLINMMVLVFLAQFGSLALVAALALCAWYLVQGGRNGVLLLGVVMVPITAATYAGAAAYHNAFSVADGAWYASTIAAANPILWIVVLSLVQAASHGPEPKVPPRVTGTAHWQTLREFVLGSTRSRHGTAEIVRRLARSTVQVFFGALDEFWASWRLINLNVLELMWRLGYQPQMYAKYKDLSRRAIAHGDPAIDFIGVGGGTRLRDPGG